MYAKKENGRWHFTRTGFLEIPYVEKDTKKEGIHRKRTYVSAGGLPLDAEDVPEEMQRKYLYTVDELSYLEEKVFSTARAARLNAEQEAIEKDRDPNWRLADAGRALTEAVQACGRHGSTCESRLLAELSETLASLAAKTPAFNQGPLELAEEHFVSACASLSELAALVGQGDFPEALDTPTKQRLHKQWLFLTETRSSLQAALQSKSYVGTRNTTKEKSMSGFGSPQARGSGNAPPAGKG